MWKCVLIVFSVSQLAVLVTPYTPLAYLNYYYPPLSDLPASHDRKCLLGVRQTETVDLQGVICGKTEVDVEVWKGICLNDGSDCMSSDFAFACFSTKKYCLPGATETVTQSVTVTGPNNCQQTIQIRFENITECDCATKATSSSC